MPVYMPRQFIKSRVRLVNQPFDVGTRRCRGLDFDRLRVARGRRRKSSADLTRQPCASGAARFFLFTDVVLATARAVPTNVDDSE
jgi:hypothetical protein